MRKLLMVFLVLCLFATSALARELRTVIRDDEGIQYENVNLRGVSISTGTGVGHQIIGTGDVLIYDIFVICTTSATTGSVYLTNTAATALMTLDVPSANAAGTVNTAGKSRSVCPWAYTGIPVAFEDGIKVYTSAAGVVVYVLYID